MKKALAMILILVMVMSMAACGGSAIEKELIGMWKLVDTESEEETEYGLGIEFTKDGKLRYGLTEDVLEGLEVEENDMDDAMEGLEMLMTIEYEVLSENEMEVTASAFMGLASESATIAYSLDGDTLEFDGATYKRAK